MEHEKWCKGPQAPSQAQGGDLSTTTAGRPKILILLFLAVVLAFFVALFALLFSIFLSFRGGIEKSLQEARRFSGSRLC